jgi:hypothetical protein
MPKTDIEVIGIFPRYFNQALFDQFPEGHLNVKKEKREGEMIWQIVKINRVSDAAIALKR